MRIESQKVETNIQSVTVKAINTADSAFLRSKNAQIIEEVKPQIRQLEPSKMTIGEQKETVTQEKVEEAVRSINEFLHTQQKSSKFVFHEGLDKYYVKLVNAETEEIIKEIPPERLLNAFYEMQKLAGMIVDEKI